MDNSPSPLVLVAVINWNRLSETIRCISGLCELDYPRFSVLVIDNGSSAGCFEGLEHWFRVTEVSSVEMDPVVGDMLLKSEHSRSIVSSRQATVRAASTAHEIQVHLIRLSENLGFVGGCNIAGQIALAMHVDSIFFVNNDAWVEKGTLKELVRVFAETNAGVVGATIVSEDGKILFSGRSWPWHLFGLRRKSRTVESAEWIASQVDGCAMLVTCNLIARRVQVVGSFLDPRFFMYYEDIDLCLFAEREGMKSVVSKYAKVGHSVAASSGGWYNPRSYYYLTRNRIYLANRWLSTFLKILFHLWYFPSRLLICLVRILSQGRRGSYASSAVLRGLFHGYMGIGGMWSGHDSIGPVLKKLGS